MGIFFQRRWLRWGGLALLLMLAVWMAGQGAREGLAWHWNRQLDESLDDQWAGQLQRLLALGEPGLRRVALRVGASRRERCELVGRVLQDRLDQLKLASPRMALHEMTLLAEVLASNVETWEPPARDVAAGLVRRMMEVRGEFKAGDARRLLLSCERVIQATVPLEATQLPRDVSVENRREVVEYQRFEREPAYETWVEVESLELPGGALPMTPFVGPIEVVAAEENDAEASPSVDLESGSSEPRLFVAEPNLLRDLPAEGAAPNDAQTVERERRVAAQAQVPETIRLVMLLHEGDHHQVAQAQAGLREQGFSQGQIEVAKLLFDRDPRVRQQWARQLPLVPGMNAKPWLLWLMKDESADVRVVAVSVLATSNDPDLLERMREIAAQDADPRVRKQAERYLSGTRRR